LRHLALAGVTLFTLVGCSGTDEASGPSSTSTRPTATAPSTTVAEPATTTTEQATTTSTSSSTTTTVDPSWNRDAELAVRACLDGVMFADDWVEFMFDFDDPEPVREIADLCEAAGAQLDLEDGPDARFMAVLVTGMTADLSIAVLSWANGEAPPPSGDYFARSLEAEALIP
jgi:hypothetical protein